MGIALVSNLTASRKDEMRQDIRAQLVAKLSNKEYRDIFVSEQINTGLAFQIKALREQRGWSQTELGQRAGMAQSRISVMEDANYSRFSLNTLKRLASAFDVGLVVRFAPYSELVTNFVSLSPVALEAQSFDKDDFAGPQPIFDYGFTGADQKITVVMNTGAGTPVRSALERQIVTVYGYSQEYPQVIPSQDQSTVRQTIN